MTHADFRRKQAEMDEAGVLTHIRTIRVSKVFVRYGDSFDDKIVKIYRYKYRYEVLVNGEIMKQCKSRGTAKNFLIEFFEAKKGLEAAQAKLEQTIKKINTRQARKLEKVAAV